MKIKVSVVTNGVKNHYQFKVLSDMEGLSIRLTKYTREENGRGGKRVTWADFGNDGTFIHRSNVPMPGKVIEDVRNQAINAIKVANID